MNQTLFQVVLTVVLIGAALIGGKRYIDQRVGGSASRRGDG
jgi:hypothetical protein